MWLSLVERCVRDAKAAGSNPVIPTRKNKSVRIYFFYSKAKDSNLKRPRRKMRQSGGLSKSRVSKGAGELLQDGRSRSDMRKSCHPDQ